jgi:hypothetical protein
MFTASSTLTWTTVFNLLVAATPTADIAIGHAIHLPTSYTPQAPSGEISVLRKQVRDTVIRNSTTLDKSWNGAVLFSLYAAFT